MGKLRLLFIKEAQASYISHLDLMRTFQRVFPRGGLELRHSQGFHPHPLLSLVLPLPVGQSSVCELLDFEVEQEHDGTGISDTLNSGLPAGLSARSCYPVRRPAKELAFLRARLEMDYDKGVPADATNHLLSLFDREEVLVEKRTKHKELTQLNLVPLLRSVKWTKDERMISADVVAAAQNPGLNPALLGSAVSKYLPELSPDFVRVRRLELYDAEMNVFR